MKSVVISDHALLRYIERVHGVDIDRLRKIVSDLISDAATAGATSYSVDGFTYSISQRGSIAALKTVLPESSPSAAARGGFRAVGKHMSRRHAR